MNKKLSLLIFIFFIQGIVSNMHHPLMPSYVQSLGLPNYMFGFFFAFMNIGTMFGGPFWGNLGDQGKKKFVVIIGFIIYGLNQMFFGMGQIFNQWFLSIFRFLSGFGIAAALTVIAGEIIVISPSDKRTRNIAFGAASLALGGSVGQFLGGFIHTNQFLIKVLKTNSFFNALLVQCVLVLLLAFFTFLTFKPEENNKKSNQKRVQFWEGFKEIKNIKIDLLFFLLALSFITIAATNVDKYLDIYFVSLGYKANKLGNFKMIVGLVSILASIVLVPLVMKIRKPLLLISILQILSAIIIFVVFNSQSSKFITYIYSIFMIYIIFKALYEPLERDYIANYSTMDNIATTMGIRQSFFSMGTIIGPIFGAFLYDYNSILVFNVSVIIYVVSVFLLIISNMLKKRNKVEINIKD